MRIFYIYIYIERERERYICICIYIYMYQRIGDPGILWAENWRCARF